MRIYKPSSSDVKLGLIAAVLLIVGKFVEKLTDSFIDPVVANLTVGKNTVKGLVNGFIVGLVLMLVGQGKYAALGFAVILGSGIAADVMPYVASIQIPAQTQS